MAHELMIADEKQHPATFPRRRQQVALELILAGHSDNEIAQAIGVRRETVWKWRQRDGAFRAELQTRRAAALDSAVERLQGMADRAVSVVQRDLGSPTADSKLAILLLKELGVFERSRGVDQDRRVFGAAAFEVTEDDELDQKLEAVEAEQPDLWIEGGDGRE